MTKRDLVLIVLGAALAGWLVPLLFRTVLPEPRGPAWLPWALLVVFWAILIAFVYRERGRKGP